MVSLPYAVTVPAGSLMYADSISLSHAWPTVQTGINDHLYVQERVTGQASDTLRTIQLDAGTYNAEELKDHVVAKLNGAGKVVPGTYAVQHGKLTLSSDLNRHHDHCHPSYMQIVRTRILESHQM